MAWQPNASLANLHTRAKLLANIRQFFADRQVLEVDTPLLASTTVTDPHITSIPALCKIGSKEEIRFLQTSPEYAMKRLLASNSGSIYQICKAFRQNDLGNNHNPEFTLLEWYRIGFDHHALMDEVDALLQITLQTKKALRVSYATLFEEYLHINPHTVAMQTLKTCAKQKLNFTDTLPHKNAWFDLLFTHCIEPHFANTQPVFLYDFPAPQAALARIRPGNPPLASRFEVYFRGIELANGFHELTDEKEQRQRFENDRTSRQQQALPDIIIDEKFLMALKNGLPDCAGVAMGVDRLVMLATQCSTLKDVLSFGFENA